METFLQQPTQSSCSIRFRGGIARFLELEALKQHPAWPDAFAGRCKDRRFYEIIEEALHCGFEHRYVVLEDASREVRAIQPIFFVQQNLVEGVPALRATVESIRRRFPRFLTMRVLMAGCAAGEGHLGAIKPGDESWMAGALRSVLPSYARSCGASLVVLKDFPAGYRDALSSLVSGGFARVPSMPMTCLRLRDYNTFDDYLHTLSKATRKDLRRKFKRAAKADPITLEVVNDVSPFVDEIYPRYLEVHHRSTQKFEQLTPEFFCSLGQRMPDRARFFLWRQSGRIVAFSLCLVHEGVMFDDCLGLDYRVALDLHLYFYTLRDLISWAIAEGLHTYCSSPLNYNPKLHLGCELVPLDLYVLHTQPLLNPVFRRAVKFLEPTRHDPVLRRFPNAHELK